jgi:hypothetical protein
MNRISEIISQLQTSLEARENAHACIPGNKQILKVPWYTLQTD